MGRNEGLCNGLQHTQRSADSCRKNLCPITRSFNGLSNFPDEFNIVAAVLTPAPGIALPAQTYNDETAFSSLSPPHVANTRAVFFYFVEEKRLIVKGGARRDMLSREFCPSTAKPTSSFHLHGNNFISRATAVPGRGRIVEPETLFFRPV